GGRDPDRRRIPSRLPRRGATGLDPAVHRSGGGKRVELVGKTTRQRRGPRGATATDHDAEIGGSRTGVEGGEPVVGPFEAGARTAEARVDVLQRLLQAIEPFA